MTKYIVKRRWELQKLFIMIQLFLLPLLGGIIVAKRDWNTLQASRVCNVSIDIVGMLILIILFFSCVKEREDNTFRTGCFTYLISLNSWSLFWDLICWCVDEIPALSLLNMIANECFYILGLAMMMMFWNYLVAVSESDDPRLERMTRVLNIGAIISVLALLGNLLGHYYFYVDQNGIYHRGKYYFSSNFYLILMMVCFILLITRMDISTMKKRALLTFVSVPILANIIQILVYGCSIVDVGIVCALIIIYGNVFAEHNREIAEQKMEIMSKEREILIAKREHERIETELNLASDIQTHVIPRTFPPFPHHKEFDLYASMTPAKEVGGDFYDFFEIDEHHIALVIADVSGKGIPAALYMMIAKMMIKNAAMQGMSPKEIFEFVNNQLCESVDDVEMFVTAWIGILDVESGIVTAANAGHEYPAICHKDGNFEIMKDKHGLVLGGMEGMRYKEYEFVLEPGGTLFVYTDGVTEATDMEQKLFGMENMILALNNDPSSKPETLLRQVRAEIDLFVGDEDQFDDITMLAIKMNDKE